MKLGIAPGLSFALVTAAIAAIASPPVAADGAGADRDRRPGSAQHVTGDEVPAGLTRDEWAQIRRRVTAASYHASPAPRAGADPALRAANARQRYGATFRPEGIGLAASTSVDVPWRLGLTVTGYGYEGDLRRPEDAAPTAVEDRVEYRRGLLTEWYVNRPAGLEQGFEIQDPGTRTGRPLVVSMAVEGDMRARADESGVSFADRSGQVLLRYSGLKSWDADGRPLGSRVELADREIRLVVDARDARFPVTVDPTFTHEAQFIGHGDLNELAATGFGCAVAVEGDTVAIGAFAEAGGPGPSVGAAYVFVRLFGAFWVQQQKLVPLDPASFDQFGWSIALSGETVVVGSPYDDISSLDDVGSAYVYTRSGTTWSQQQKLVASDGTTGDQFGRRVSILGDTIVAGAPFDDTAAGTDVGSVYVFVRSGTVWTEQQRVSPADAAAGDTFGHGLSLGVDTLLAGSPLDDTAGGADAGSAYVFVRSGTTWTQQQKLLASDAEPGDSFGAAVSVSGNTAVVGAPEETNAEGAAYVFVRSGTTWTEQQKVVASDGAPNDEFGTSVAVSGDTLIAGSPFDGAIVGSAYVFVRAGTTWTEQQKLVSGGGSIDFLGFAVSLSGDTAMVGAHASGVGVGAAYAFARSGTTWSLQQRLLPPYLTAGDMFARSVSVSGTTVVMGSPLDDTPPNGANSGSAFVFARPGGFWTEETVLRPLDGQPDDNFGASVAVFGNTAVVGAPVDDTAAGADAGSAYVFLRTGAVWTEQQKLTASDAAAGDLFGSSVAIHGDTAVVGAPEATVGGNNSAGAVYVFVRAGTTWTEEQKIAPADGAALDAFGSSVSISTDTAVMGAPGDDTSGGADAGSAYVFLRAGTTWTQQQKLAGSGAAASDAFGTAVSVSSNTAVVGAPDADAGSGGEGAAYVFQRSGTTWTEQEKLVASDGLSGDDFGQAVSVSGDTALVGAPGADTASGADAGAMYVYFRAGTTWTEEPRLLAPDAAAGDAFGFSVSVDGNLAAGGAPLDDTTGGPDSGSVNIFRKSTIVDLAVTKTDGQTVASPGEVITYTIVVSNAGPEAATDAVVTDTVPAALLGATWTCTASAGSSCTASGAGNINDTVDLLVAGTATYLLTGTVAPAASGTLVNTVTVALAPGGTDPNPANNTATDTDTLQPEADVLITKTDAPDPAQPAGPLVYTLTVTNTGPSTATGITVVDTLPAGVTFVSSTPGPPTCALAGQTLTCNLGSLAGSASATVTINTTVNAANGILANTATVSATEPDPFQGNNSASASTAIGRRDGELGHGTDEVYDLAALPGPAADEDVYRMRQRGYSSYEVLVDATSGDIGAGSGPILERLGADGTTVLQTSLPVGAGPSRSLRWANTAAPDIEDQSIRVRSAGCGTDCGPDDIYRIRVYETTYAVPRVNNSGTQITVLILQNPTSYAIGGEAYIWNTSGALMATHPFTLAPKAALALNTATIPGASGVSGTLTVAHDGRYGELAGKTVALEPATGFSFDSGLEPRASLGGRRPVGGGP